MRYCVEGLALAAPLCSPFYLVLADLLSPDVSRAHRAFGGAGRLFVAVG